MDKIIKEIIKELKTQIDPDYRDGSIRFFNEPIKVYSVRTEAVRKIARKYLKEVKPFGKKEIFKLAEELIKTNYNELATIAFSWVYSLRKEFTKSDFGIFEKWVKNYLTNWAMVDDLCTHSVGHLITEFPELIPKIKKWTKSKNLWVRRASAVSFIFASNTYTTKSQLSDIFEIADSLLSDEDDLVQKGYGWMLKAASNKYPAQIFNYVIKRKNQMPRIALRYAIEKYPAEMRKEAMKK